MWTLNRADFYEALRRGPLFGASLTQEQVDGMENLLDVWFKYMATERNDTDSAADLAYNLATSYHETAYRMQPIYEYGPPSYFRKYDPGTRLGKSLGNTQPGDGYRFRGAGHVQLTGRRNARKASNELANQFRIHVDLEASPEKRLDPLISALCLFAGNEQGWWTGRALEDYIDDVEEEYNEDLREFANARRVVNGTDKQVKIAKHAMDFYAALKAADYRWVEDDDPEEGVVIIDDEMAEIEREVDEVEDEWLRELLRKLINLIKGADRS